MTAAEVSGHFWAGLPQASSSLHRDWLDHHRAASVSTAFKWTGCCPREYLQGPREEAKEKEWPWCVTLRWEGLLESPQSPLVVNIILFCTAVGKCDQGRLDTPPTEADSIPTWVKAHLTD